MTELKASLEGLASFSLYLGTGLGLSAVFLGIYVLITPHKELTLIRKGNTAAAISLSGVLFGFLLPLASAIVHSVGLLDMVIWGIIALVTQIAAYIMARLLIPNLSKDISSGKVAQGIFLASLSLAVGLLDAACMSW